MAFREPNVDSNGRDIRPLLCPNGRLYVCAEKYDRAVDFAAVHRIPRSKLVFIRDEWTLKGLRGITVYFIGQWWRGKRAQDQEALLIVCKAIDITIIEVADWR